MRPSSQHGSHESYCYTTLLSVGACFQGCYFVSFILAGGDTAWRISQPVLTTEFTSADYFGSEDSPKMGHFVVSAAVDVRVGKNIKQPAGRGEYKSDTYIYILGRATM